MKIRITSNPEGAIVRNENFDKIGRTPFEIEISEHMNQKIFINYDGIIKEHRITEATTNIHEDLVSKVEENAQTAFDNGYELEADLSKSKKHTSNLPTKNYVIGALGLILLAGIGYVGIDFWSSNKDQAGLNDKTTQTTTEITSSTDSLQDIAIQENLIEAPQEPVILPKQNVDEVATNGITEAKPKDVTLEATKLDENVARNTIAKAIWMENSKNIDGLKNLFASNITRYKTKNNLSKKQLERIYQEWWGNIISEEKQIANIVKIDDYMFKAKINHKYDVDGDSEREVIYYGIYKLNKDGKITELYVD